MHVTECFYEKSLSKATLERQRKALKSQIRNFTKFAKQPIYPILSKHNKKKYLAHIIRRPNNALIKQITFSNEKQKKKGRPSQTLYTTVLKSEMTDIARFARNSYERVF